MLISAMRAFKKAQQTTPSEQNLIPIAASQLELSMLSTSASFAAALVALPGVESAIEDVVVDSIFNDDPLTEDARILAAAKAIAAEHFLSEEYHVLTLLFLTDTEISENEEEAQARRYRTFDALFDDSCRCSLCEDVLAVCGSSVHLS
jgi:hypothetical protein